MDSEFLGLLRDPLSGAPLELVREDRREFLAGPDGRRYPVESGIVRFLAGRELDGNNRRYRRLYDRLAPFYDLSTWLYARVKRLSVAERIGQYLGELEVGASRSVIEISVGTGRNLVALPPAAAFYGVDISMGMLKRCTRAMKRVGRSVSLVEAEAENLPFRDEAFDIVFSAGGFNFFNDRGRAVREMLRIAKRGTKLLISDETEKIRARFDKGPVTKKFYGGQAAIAPAGAFLPPECLDIAYREVCDGELYALTFRKP